jgi:hypothetical protein
MHTPQRKALCRSNKGYDLKAKKLSRMSSLEV